MIDYFLLWTSVYSQDIYVNIIAGIIASFIVLASQTIVKIIATLVISLFDIKYYLINLWRFINFKTIYVVSGSIECNLPIEIKTAILSGPDSDAASVIIATLGLLYPNSEIHHVYSSSFPIESYKENLVIVGGPVNNYCSKLILDQIKTIFYYKEDFGMVLEDSKNNSQYTYNTVINSNGLIVDYGAIIRIKNPLNPMKDVIIVSGCDSNGVLAAARTISSKKEVKQVRKQILSTLGVKNYFKAQNYIIIVECFVLGNDIGHIKLKQVANLNDKRIYTFK